MENDIPDFNDRCTLVLLEKKSKKSLSDKWKIDRLRYRYSNYEVYEEALFLKLISMGYLESFQTHPPTTDPDTGYEIPDKDNVIYYITSKPGEKALINNYFPSDYWDKFWKNKAVRVGIVITSTTGFIMGLTKLIEFISSIGK